MASTLLFNKYDNEDNFIDSYETLEDAIVGDKAFKERYYRLNIFEDRSRDYVTTTHFGINIKSKGNSYFELGDYINAFINYMVNKDKVFFPKRRNQDTKFFILTKFYWYEDKMSKISKLSKNDFTKEIDTFLKTRNQFRKVLDLNEYSKKPGLYILVLNHYNQCYIGQSKDIKARILQHWRRNDYYNGTGIDMFKALDTTHIYAYVMDNMIYRDYIDMYEYETIFGIDRKYLLNQQAGGGTMNLHIFK